MIFMPTILFAKQKDNAKESQEILLEEGNVSATKSMTKSLSGVSSSYNSSAGEIIVNSMQRDPFYRVLDQLGMDETGLAVTDYDLSDLTLVGVVWDIPNPLAMFRGPKGKRYILRKDDKIGRNSGLITGIDQGEVNIREIFTDIAGKKKEKTTIKSVKKDI